MAKFQNKKEMKGEIDKYTIRVRYFNILLSIIDRTNIKKISRHTEEHHCHST